MNMLESGLYSKKEGTAYQHVLVRFWEKIMFFFNIVIPSHDSISDNAGDLLRLAIHTPVLNRRALE